MNKLVLIIVLTIFFCKDINAQYSISGFVKDHKNQPLEMVTIITENQLDWTVTDKNGFYKIKNISHKKTKLTFKRLGLAELTIPIYFTNEKAIKKDITLYESNLALNEISVTGNLKKKTKTSTIIKKNAISHLQASSLSDVMQLIPGQLIKNQNFDNVTQALIRQKDTRDGAEDASSFGTNIRLNGITLSNNSNLQNMSSALRGNTNYFNSTAGRGLDLRKISVDNIEKIEIIKGIPSASYGDITSGVILIETKKGYSPFLAKQRITPKTYQTSISKGFLLPNKNTLNIDFEYTKSIINEREKDLNYNKIKGLLVYSSSFFKTPNTQTTTSLSLEKIFDGNNDDEATTIRKSKQKGIQFSFNTNWYTDKKWAKKVTFDVATSYSVANSFDKQIVNTPLNVLSLFKESNEGEGIFLPQTYISKVKINGKPFSFYTKITNQFTKSFLQSKHLFLSGLEYNLEKNFGNGVSFNPKLPPEGLGFQTLRERPYKSVPALKQVSLFVEDAIKFSLGTINNELTLGLRMDNFQPKNILQSKYNIQLAPRIQFSSKITKNLLIKGGWGIASKAPSLLHIYPDNAFFDLVSLNHFTGNPTENLVILTTKKINTNNTNLKPAKSFKQELGFNYSWKKNSIDIIAYKEKTHNALGFSQQVAFIPYNIYKVTQKTNNAKPIYKLNGAKSFIGLYSIPENRFDITNKGIEFQMDFSWKSPLSFQLSGAYTQTKSTYIKDDYSIYTNPTNGNQLVGSYKNGGTNRNEQFNSTLRSILHIPELKFIVSTAIQTIWYEQQKQENYATTPYEYANSDGVFQNFKNLNNTNLIKEFKRNSNTTEKNNKPIWLFTLNLSKEIGKNGRLSFFVNNLFNNQPVINKRIRNIPFFYGFEASLKL